MLKSLSEQCNSRFKHMYKQAYKLSFSGNTSFMFPHIMTLNDACQQAERHVTMLLVSCSSLYTCVVSRHFEFFNQSLFHQPSGHISTLKRDATWNASMVSERCVDFEELYVLFNCVKYLKIAILFWPVRNNKLQKFAYQLRHVSVHVHVPTRKSLNGFSLNFILVVLLKFANRFQFWFNETITGDLYVFMRAKVTGWGITAWGFPSKPPNHVRETLITTSPSETSVSHPVHTKVTDLRKLWRHWGNSKRQRSKSGQSARIITNFVHFLFLSIDLQILLTFLRVTYSMEQPTSFRPISLNSIFVLPFHLLLGLPNDITSNDSFALA
jgi:hypothetical protein